MLSTILLSTLASAAVVRDIPLAVPVGHDASIAAEFDAHQPNRIIPEVVYLDDLDDSGIPEFEEFVPDGVAQENVTEILDNARRSIFPPDDRHLWNDPVFPNIAAGRFILDDNSAYCSGALVGPRHVLIAAHCLGNNPQAPGRFAPGYDNGERFGGGNSVRTYFPNRNAQPDTPCWFKSDWAIVVIDRRLGDEVGFLGMKLPTPASFDLRRFFHIGYPADRDNGWRPYRLTSLAVTRERSLDCDGTGPVYTFQSDVLGGQSGGPLWELTPEGRRFIWGDLSVYFGNWVGWASGNGMMDALRRARNDFP